MIHGDSVANPDGVKDQRGATGSLNAGFDGIDEFIQMNMAGYDFIKRIGDADERSV
jgi:hypothetical protein